MCYDTVFNVMDGVIIVSNIQPNLENEPYPLASTNDFNNLSTVLGAVFYKIHTKKKIDMNVSDKSKEKFERAQQLVEDGVETKHGRDIDTLPSGVLGSWLPKRSFRKGKVSQQTIETQMQACLNYVVVFVKPNTQAYRVINNCLQLSQIGDVKAIPWTGRQTYTIGQPCVNSQPHNFR